MERRTAILDFSPRPRRWVFAGTTAWRQDADFGALPDELRRTEGNPSRLVPVPVCADLLRIGKFDVDTEVRLRAFYATAGLSIRLQANAGREASGVARTVRAHEQVSRHVPALMPRVEDHGITNRSRTAYLVEELLHGSHPTREQLPEVAEALARQLHLLHQGVGVASCPLSTVVHPQTRARWETFVRTGVVGLALDRAVHRLLERDALLEVSLTHGDLVSSNILVREGRTALIDWEYAGEQPIAFDLAKVHLNSVDQDATQASLQRGLQQSLGYDRDHYAFPEQLALAHIRVLSWHQPRRRKSEAAGRTGFLDRQTRHRLQSIARLLGTEA